MSEREIYAECSDCGGTFKGCICKTCSKCTTPFKCYLGTSLPKTRSHCRYCGAAICPSCLLSGIHPIKSCNPCHVAFVRKVQRGQDALISLSVESSGIQGEDPESAAASTTYPVSPTMSFKDMSVDEQHIWLSEAVKKGNHPLISMLLDSGASVDLTDTSENPILFTALRHGHLACVALMMERGVDIHRCNAEGNTALHVVGRYGTTAQHAECCEMLVEMGADVFSKNTRGRTALDLAVRHSSHVSIITSLRRSQLGRSLLHLQDTLHLPATATVRYGELHRSIACVVDFLSLPDEERVENVSSLTPPPLSSVAAATSGAAACMDACTSDLSLTLADRNGGDGKALSRQHSSNSLSAPSSPTASRSPSPKIPDKIIELNSRIQQLSLDKQRAELRCQELVETVAKSAQHSAEKVRQADLEMDRLRQTHKEAIQRVDALNTNRTTKLRAECETTVFEANQRCHDAERSFRDLNALQQGLKLTWVQDELVSQCMSSKCRASFTQLVRRHHCRSCGRIFCKACLANCISLPTLGYEDAVKVCSTCFALVDEVYTGTGHATLAPLA